VSQPDTSRAAGILTGESIVAFAGEDWWYHNPHSNKHLMQEFARAGNKVLFINSTGLRTPSLRGDRYAWKRIVRKLRSMSIFLRRAEPRLYVLTPVAFPVTKRLRRFVVALNQALVILQTRVVCAFLGMSRPIFWVGNPGVVGGAVAMRRRWAKVLVYYCCDNIAFLTGADTSYIQRLQRRLLAASDLILFTGRRMLKDWVREYSGARLLSHGVELKHFSQAQRVGGPIPEELRGISGPIVGYIGEIRDLDIALMTEVARRNPQLSWVLIGHVMQDVSGFAALPNVHFLGKRPYESLPRYMQCFQCTTIFYRAGDTFNDYRSAKKLLEYFATGLPLVSTTLAELDSVGHLAYQAANAEEFHDQLHRALNESDPELRRQRIELAAARDWSVVAAEASDHILRALASLSRKPFGTQLPQISS
jgi:glycosyltransferase involved in cell wall biosynthesis